MESLKKQFGFGSEEYDNFVSCGRRMQRLPDGALPIVMKEYSLGIEPVVIPRHRKAQLEPTLNPGEHKQNYGSTRATSCRSFRRRRASLVDCGWQHW